MWKCPICETLNDNTLICSECNFDETQNYLHYPSVALLPSSIVNSPEKILSGTSTHKIQLLAEHYELGRGVPKNQVKALRYYTIAAKAGDSEAQYQLGRCYFWGVGVPINEAEAIQWYQKAAQQDNAEAQFELGECYYYGYGIPTDQVQAVQWYQKAAKQNKALAQYRLAECYQQGKGVPKSKKNALIWYQKAADFGYEPAKERIKH